MRVLVLLSALTALFLGASEAKSKWLTHVTEENWRDMLHGEWMLEFHAPWCPACKDLSKTWDSFAEWSQDLNIMVGEVDVTTNPGLSGRFLVTALPTIYHVKDGVFRSYNGPRDKEDFMKFIEEKKWTVVEPVASWKYPDSPQMGVVAMFFRLSMHVRDLHNYMIEDKGLPSWASYCVFGLATLVLGCILGFFIVCIIDSVFPATPAAAPQTQIKQKHAKQDKKQNGNAQSDDKDSNGEVRNRKADKQANGDANKTKSPGSPEKKKNK